MNLDILLPTLNSERTINKALESLLNASKRTRNLSLQVLIADGGSQDLTLSLINQFDKGLKITVVSHADASPEEALSIAFNCSKADFVMPMGSDDYISTDYFSALVSDGVPEEHILLPSKFIFIKSGPMYKTPIIKTRNIRRGFILRYSIPCPGLGWIARTSDLRKYIQNKGQSLYTNNYYFATDNELFYNLISEGWQYKITKNNLSQYYFLEGGRSSYNRNLLSREACHIAQMYSPGFNLDIRLIYFIYRNIQNLKSYLRKLNISKLIPFH